MRSLSFDTWRVWDCEGVTVIFFFDSFCHRALEAGSFLAVFAKELSISRWANVISAG